MIDSARPLLSVLRTRQAILLNRLLDFRRDSLAKILVLFIGLFAVVVLSMILYNRIECNRM